MKKILFFLMIFSGMLLFGAPKEVAIPDENMKYENSIVTYMGVPYTGKLIGNEADKTEGFDAYISLKNGHLDGTTEIKNPRQDMYILFTVVNGKFHGIVKVQVPGLGEAEYTYDMGKIKIEKAKLADGIESDVAYDSVGRVNGIMIFGGESLTFKNGEANFQGEKMTAKVNYKTNKIEMTLGEEKIEQDLLTVEKFEAMILPSITE